MFFEANDIKEEKQVAVFLSVIGSKTFALLRSLVLPESPKDKTLAELVTVLKQHFEPKPVIIVQRFHFHHRNQEPGESVADYVAELRRSAATCKFEGYLDEALRDRLVCGLRDEGVQRRLLTEPELTLAKAIELAQGMETAARDTQEMKGAAMAIKAVVNPPRKGVFAEGHTMRKTRS